MQLVEPQERIRAGIADTIAASGVAVVDVTCDVQRSSTVKVLGRVVVDVFEQRVDIVDRKVRAGIAFLDLDGKWSTVLVKGVDGDDLLQHTIGYRRQVVE